MLARKNFPKASRGSPREGQKIQKAQIQPSETSFDRENDIDYEYNLTIFLRLVSVRAQETLKTREIREKS